ncbi:OmpA family protein [Sphingomonas silueang]|uniref:OmpA family protein n=1 Tax=Sphingomonas silueang TaxID=3156617 RepID=UPI0032B4C38F
MNLSRFEHAAGRPLWLTTLADLSLLLVGFFVFVHATQGSDRTAQAAGIRAAFDAPPPPMAVAALALDGFAPGSAILPASYGALVAEVREAARDPRIAVTLTGASDGDADPATGSGAILAADRARAVAAVLVAQGAVRPGQISFAAPATGGRHVRIDLGFAGERQGVADRQPPPAAPTDGVTR